VLTNRPADVCFQDEEFGRQFLAGFNPSVICALKQLPSELGSAITEEDVAGGAGCVDKRAGTPVF
jgi:lipoxygenase/linoleate 9S-lipoxygenase